MSLELIFRNLAGEITAVRQRPDVFSAWENVATGIGWLPFGGIDTMTRGNGVIYNATYDASYRLTGQTDTSAATLRDILYGYSLRDNLTSAADLLDPSRDATYSYDPRQMLDGATGPWGALGFTYDPVGNRVARSLTPPGGSASTDTYTYELTSNGLDVIGNPAAGSRSYSHDGAGNTVAETRTLAGAGNWTYVYNDFGRLASASLNGGLQAEYLTNALGQQVSRTVGSAVTLSVHDLAGNRIAEHDGTGAVIREYIWLDGRPLAVVEGGQVFHLHWDHIMRPVMATDATGAVVWAASYLPFGGIDQVWVDTGALAQTLRFPGQWFQAETGLHQNWMRDYDPTTGRYLQADPLGLVDGPSVYGYARQSPVRYLDPDALDAFVYYWGQGTYAGHTAIATHRGIPQGQNPKEPGASSCCLTVPGEIKYEDLSTAEEGLRIPLGITDTMRVQRCIQRRKVESLPYKVLSNSCVDFVRICLSEAGIVVPDFWRPKSLFNYLKDNFAAETWSLPK